MRVAYSSDPSERAKQLVREGKFGGAGRGQGRPRVKRASEIAAEAAAGHADEIVAALRAGLDPDESAETRSRAADRWLRLVVQEGALAQRERSEDRADADQYARLTADEVRHEFAQMLADAVRSGELPVGDVIELAAAIPDADVIEDVGVDPLL
ncbi:hypothetical protein LRS13_13480 [Svornostia abyssi]|uniref:DUF5681 domain-containing protein n=1 Tax=Svornostia abyssi TaxID=2898438 RepID=A0ABY5PAN3_9ACTN|nr:hypothetical protein LRS13_13480 [Parviterribacteraceae bacterium J379]